MLKVFNRLTQIPFFTLLLTGALLFSLFITAVSFNFIYQGDIRQIQQKLNQAAQQMDPPLSFSLYFPATDIPEKKRPV